MNIRLICELVLGGLVGVALSAAMLYGIIELADWIVEQTDDAYSYSIPDRR